MTSAVEHRGVQPGATVGCQAVPSALENGTRTWLGACTAVSCWASWAEVISTQAVGALVTRSLGPQFRVQASSCWALSGTTRPGSSTLDLLPRLRGEDTGQ